MNVQIELLQIVAAAAARLNIDIMLIGAFARDYWSSYYNLTGCMRTTFDIDFSCQVAAWDEFQNLFDLLISDFDLKRDPKKTHSLWLRNDISLDLVPCGNIADANGTIAWPPEYRTTLCVLGYDVAKQDSVLVPFGNCKIKVIKPYWLALLKLQSFIGNPFEREKDLQDLFFLVSNYCDCIDQDHRLFAKDGIDHDLLVDSFDYKLVGAELIRRDCQRFNQQITDQICASVRKFGYVELVKALCIASHEDSSETAEKIIDAFI